MSDKPFCRDVSPPRQGVSIAQDAWLAVVMNRAVHTVAGVLVDGQEEMMKELRLLTGRPGFIFARVATHEIRTSTWLEECGFRLVDTALTLEGKALVRSKYKDARIRFATPEDEKAVLDIARRSFCYSRFHLDPQIPRTLADEIKARWAANYFIGLRGDHMIVVERDEHVVGFLQLVTSPDQDLTIDLIAVDQNYRGLGLAEAMIQFACSACNHAGIVRAGTQSANLPSLALYHKLGLHIVSCRHVLHHHGAAHSVDDKVAKHATSNIGFQGH